MLFVVVYKKQLRKSVETKNYNYLSRLQSELEKRKSKNSSYSLRSFARDLGINPAALSLILRKKRHIPKNQFDHVVSKIELSPEEETLFKESFENRHKMNIEESDFDDQFILGEEYYSIIAEWEHYAVLSLTEVKGFQPRPEYIAKRLGISIERTLEVLETLEINGLINRKDNEITLTHNVYRTTEDISSQALNASHLQTLDMAKSRLTETSPILRDYSSETFALGEEEIQQIKNLIRELGTKASKTAFKSPNKKHVYQLAVQFFPITKVE